jgi:hypothetical protein
LGLVLRLSALEGTPMSEETSNQDSQETPPVDEIREEYSDTAARAKKFLIYLQLPMLFGSEENHIVVPA